MVKSRSVKGNAENAQDLVRDRAGSSAATAPFPIACSRRSDSRAREKNSGRKKKRGETREGKGERTLDLALPLPPPPPFSRCTRSPLTAALYYLNAWNRLPFPSRAHTPVMIPETIVGRISALVSNRSAELDCFDSSGLSRRRYVRVPKRVFQPRNPDAKFRAIP